MYLTLPNPWFVTAQFVAVITIIVAAAAIAKYFL
jgi:hypothetical protein